VIWPPSPSLFLIFFDLMHSIKFEEGIMKNGRERERERRRREGEREQERETFSRLSASVAAMTYIRGEYFSI
jgi:hypothetical protein